MKIVNVTTGQTFDVTVGLGGSGSSNVSVLPTAGQNSSFGSLLVAMGGFPPVSNQMSGGNGGSGGGAGSTFPSNFSGNGGSGGNNGTKGWSSNNFGLGQGFWNFAALQFKYAKFSAGAGGNGSSSTYCIYGGGGGGGILFNGTGPTSGSIKCCNSVCKPTSAIGYGAGGSAGNFYFPASSGNAGGKGASGLVYIEY